MMSIRSSNLALRLLLPVLFISAVCPLLAASQSRIRTAISDTDRTPIRQTISGRAMHASDRGEAPADQTLSAIHLFFGLTDAQQADLTQLLQDQQNPSSPSYHKWLTPEQYGARFGLADADLAKIQSWVASKGLKVVEVSRSRTYIAVSGNVRQVGAAFHTQIHSLAEDGESHISNMADPELPTAISKVVTGITGLDDFAPRARAVRPRYTSSTSGNHYLAPGDFYTIYNIDRSITGKNVSIAILGQTDISLSDVAAFRSASGLASNPPTVIQATGYTSGTRSNEDASEAQLDVEWSGAIAPEASIKFVTVGANQNANVFNALVYAISNNIAPIMSISYGGCESIQSQSSLNSLNLALQQANAQGITFVGPTGDSGATDCDTDGLANGGLAVDFPGSSPFAVAVGGTMFSEGNSTGSTSYWNSNSDASTSNAGSALSYIPEAVWNESNSSTGLTAGGSGGGGVSSFFAKPAWQVANGVPQDGARDLPDISLAAAAGHDGYLFCAQGSCTNGFRNASGNLNVVGGTSAATPNFAGILALLEQKLGTGPLGNIGPKLYGLASIPNVYHDVTAGSNAISCVQGTNNCPTGAPIGYSAGAGYDLASGLGSVNVTNFINSWSAAVPTGIGTGPSSSLCTFSNVAGAVICQTTTTLAIASNTVTCGLNSTSFIFNVGVALAAGYNNPTNTAPSGTVQLLIDNKPTGSPVSLSGGTAQFQLDTTKLSSGQHQVSALYSGDSNFAGSKGALLTNNQNTALVTPIDVVSASSPDFSVTPCSGVAIAASGSTASPVTLSITPFNGFTGAVNLSASSDTGDALGYSFSVKPVTITSSSGAVTTQFVLTATVPRTTSQVQPLGAHHRRGTWYAAGSGATFACALLFFVPRGRRWTSLFVLLLSVTILGGAGCGGGGGGSGSSNTGGGSTTTQPATPGTYNITLTATSGSLVHSTVLTYQIR
jgi:subtilase family serine protease